MIQKIYSLQKKTIKRIYQGELLRYETFTSSQNLTHKIKKKIKTS